MLSKSRLFKGVQCLFLVLCCCSTGALAQSCDSLRAQDGDIVSVHCGGAPSAVFDEGGKLWVAFVQNQHVYVSASSDRGTSWEQPVQVNAEPEDTEFNGENRPKIIVRGDNVFLSWTTKTSPNYTGEIRFVRSTDGGRTYEAPRTMNDDGLVTGHRFDSLFLTEDDTLYLTWIDKRDLDAASARNETYPGAAIYYTVSRDMGKSFTRNFRVSHNSCECCRIAMAPHGEGDVAILWRQIYDETIRDHGIAILKADGEVEGLDRATVDDWHINACPHHGPTMVAANEDGQFHLAWFSAGNIHSGIHYGMYDLALGETARIMPVDATPGAGHPSLANQDGVLYMVWKGFDGMGTQLQLMTSTDEGRTWSEAQTLYTTEQASDHPLLVTSADGVWLSWLTAEHGYMFKEVSK